MYKLLIISFLLPLLINKAQAQIEDVNKKMLDPEFKKFLSKYQKYTEKIEKEAVKDSSIFPLNCEEYELKWVKAHYVSPHNYTLSQSQGGSPCAIWEETQKKQFAVDREKRYYFKTINSRYVVIFEIWDVSVFRQNEFYYERKEKKSK